MKEKMIYTFTVYTYTNDFDFIVKSKKQIKVIRTNVITAYNYVKLKYSNPRQFFELSNTLSLKVYNQREKSWFEYLAK